MDKILKIQSEIGVLSKDKENPFFNSSYFDVNQIIKQLLPFLEKYGLTVMQPLSNINGVPALKTIVMDNELKVIILEETMPLPEIADKSVKEGFVISNPNPQKMGSAITYYRRYALQSLFLLQAEDDDGNKASGKKKVGITEEEPF